MVFSLEHYCKMTVIVNSCNIVAQRERISVLFFISFYNEATVLLIELYRTKIKKSW